MAMVILLTDWPAAVSASRVMSPAMAEAATAGDGGAEG